MDSKEQSFFSISDDTNDPCNKSMLFDDEIPDFLKMEKPKSPSRSIRSRSRSRDKP